jgi:hypothetical protein
VITLLLLALAVALFSFHFYLNRVLGKSTFEYLMPDMGGQTEEETTERGTV